MIVQNVDERAPHFERCAQRARMVPIRKHRAATLEKPVQSLRKTRCESLHRARKRAMPVRLDEQMHMIRLHRKMHQARAQTFFRGVE